MIGLLYRLVIGKFTSCSHKWETIDYAILHNEEGVSVGRKYYLKCTHCGYIKQKKLIL